MELYPLKRVLIALDLSSHDEVLLQYISHLASLVDLDAVYFIHVANDLSIPEEIAAAYPDLLAPVDESLRKEIEFEISKFANLPESIQSEIIIREGRTSTETLKTIRQKDIDLVVLGRKNNKQANLKIVRKIVRAAACSVSLIPEYIPEKLDKLLVPIDFSDTSSLALKRAMFLQKKFPDMKLVAMHAYRVPAGYSKTGKTFEEFDSIMQENATKEARMFIKKHELEVSNLEWKYVCINHADLHTIMYEYAISSGVNAIVMGSRGRNALSQLILGSVAEAVIERDQYLPVIVVKDRREGLDTVDALMRL